MLHKPYQIIFFLNSSAYEIDVSHHSVDIVESLRVIEVSMI